MTRQLSPVSNLLINVSTKLYDCAAYNFDRLYVLQIFHTIVQIHGPDPCLSEPCQNGGTCDRLTDDYRCLCEPGYAGHHCELGKYIDILVSSKTYIQYFATDIDDCASHPCKHRGRCQDELSGYTCECVDDFTGVDCETRKLTLSSNLKDCLYTNRFQRLTDANTSLATTTGYVSIESWTSCAHVR